MLRPKLLLLVDTGTLTKPNKNFKINYHFNI